jgi:hypothetical protein
MSGTKRIPGVYIFLNKNHQPVSCLKFKKKHVILNEVMSIISCIVKKPD